ncbi:MAG: AraC family ligand binding domain-containing protein [Phycisphaerae bacterium]
MDKLVPQVRRFSGLEPYEQQEPGIAFFQWVLKQNEIPGTCMGHVTLEGPIHKTPGVHEDFDQVYLIYSGTGTVHLGDTRVQIAEPAAVIIPRGTKHSVQLQAGEKIKYVFVNRI